MEWILKALLFALTAGLMALTLEKTVPGISLLLSITITVLILFLAVSVLEPVLSFLRELSRVCGISGVYAEPLFKCLCIAVTTRIGVSLCKDAKQAGAAAALELIGCFSAVWTALPLMRAFLSMMEDLL